MSKWNTIDTSVPDDVVGLDEDQILARFDQPEEDSVEIKEEEAEDFHQVEPEVVEEIPSDSESLEVVTEEEPVPSEPPMEEQKDSSKETKSRYERRFKTLTEKLKAKDDYIAKIHVEQSRKEIELENRLQEYEAALASLSGNSADSSIQIAKEKLLKAKLEADVEREVEATMELQQAYAQKSRADEIKAGLPVERPQRQVASVEDSVRLHRINEWARLNQHIVNSPVYRHHLAKVDSVVMQKFNPHQPEYFDEFTKELNRTLKSQGFKDQAIPLYSLDEDEDDTVEPQVVSKPQVVPQVKKKVNPMDVVAQAPRSNSAPGTSQKRQVAKLSRDEVALAARLGVSPEVYYRQKQLMEKQTNHGFSQVYVKPSK